MKKTHYFILSASLLVVGGLLLAACYKDPPQHIKAPPCPWPELTTEGLNTFGCKINGKEWVPCVDLNGRVVGLGRMESRLRESDRSNTFAVSLTRSVCDSTYSNVDANALFSIRLKPAAIGQYAIPGMFEIAKFDWSPDGSQYGYSIIDTLAINQFRINRLDTAKNIISGQFQITLIEEQTGKKVEITDGRFDLNYYQQ